jgi:AraC-like DNA-binding protein
MAMPIECAVAPHVRGLFKSDFGPGERVMRWFMPSDELAPFVQRIWFSQWTISNGERRQQAVLPHPSANLVLGTSDASMLGVVTSAATQYLEGNGFACGAKLQPGALRAFGIERPSLLRGKFAPASPLLGGRAPTLGDATLERLVADIDGYLLSRNPRHDLISLRAKAIVEFAEDHRDVVSVSQIAEVFGLSIRSIQDTCRRAIGVSPKWLIRCFRIQDALELLEKGEASGLAHLALELGYFDQAHFTRDFKQVTGVTPGRY